MQILRTSYRISQKELAEKLYVSKQTLSNWENGNIMPSVEMLIKISVYFHVSTDFLLGLDSRMFLEITHLPIEKVALIQQIITNINQN